VTLGQGEGDGGASPGITPIHPDSGASVQSWLERVRFRLFPVRINRFSSRGRQRSVRAMVGRSIAVFVAMAMVGGLLTAYLMFRHDWNGIHRIDVAQDLGPHRPPVDPNAMNILVIGSDTRAGANRRFGAQVTGQRSDTIMVVHISPGDHSAVVLSIPRDSMVPILSCAPEAGTHGQTAQPGSLEQINSTFAFGGPGCLWKTIEQTTHIHINNFIALTFTGFEHVIDDLGGVQVCLPVAIHDHLSKLHLSAGRHRVSGAEALAFWRARYIGEGSDLQRIRRDQFLMASVLKGIARSGLLHNPIKLFQVIQDLASHGYVTTDTGLSPGKLLTIGEELRGMPTKSVQFIEVPTVPYSGNPLAWVQWAQPQSDALFHAVAHDTRLPRAHRASGSASRAALETVSPSHVDVTVLNGTQRQNLATSTSQSLSSLGFHVGTPGDATSQYTKSVIEYAARADLPAARTLARLISNVTLQQDPSIAPGTVELILGSSFSGIKSSGGSGTSGSSGSKGGTTPDGIADLATQYGGITGNVNICGDSAAFAGPDGTN
jgi:LCP family protein required for cell wall assembly